MAANAETLEMCYTGITSLLEGKPIIVQVYVDGKQVSESVFKEIQKQEEKEMCNPNAYMNWQFGGFLDDKKLRSILATLPKGYIIKGLKYGAGIQGLQIEYNTGTTKQNECDHCFCKTDWGKLACCKCGQRLHHQGKDICLISS